MPKSILQVKQFEGGLINHYDPRDIPENGLSEAVGVMCDVPGKVRTMGGSNTHVDINSGDEFTGGTFKPGFGLFAFNADFNLDYNPVPDEVETKFLAIQSSKTITIYDSSTGTMIPNQINLSLDSLRMSKIACIFYYVDGCLRISDGNVSDPKGAVTDATRSFQYISKTWFKGLLNYVIPSKWWDTTSYIFPPSCLADGSGQLSGSTSYGAISPSSSHNPNTFGVLSEGSIHIEVADGGDGGEFQGSGGLEFGCSFMYADGQESPITPFLNNSGAHLSVNTSGYGDNHAMKFKITVGLGGSFNEEATDTEAQALAFDPRISGVNLYITGDSLGNYDDPLYMANCFFGDNDNDAKFVSHDGTEVTTFTAVDCAGFTGTSAKSDYLTIKKLPSITYELRTGVSHGEETTAARYAAACVVNRRAYIGGVKRVLFKPFSLHDESATGNLANCLKQCEFSLKSVEADKMLISPLNAFDTFPARNFIDVAINDGEEITALVPFADRVLQFKNNNLYIINVSQDYEYLESENKYMGVNYPYQICLTELGVAWVNSNGCYLYDGEKITNLILGKLNPTDESSSLSPAWKQFIGENGVIGYISELKQLVIFEDPATATEHEVNTRSGACMVFDLMTQSWTRGENKIEIGPKSNLVSNYDDSLMYIAQIETGTSESINTTLAIPQGLGEDGRWFIYQVDNNYTDVDNFKLTIGSTDITNTFSYPEEAQAGETFRDCLTRQINEYVNQDVEGGDELIPDADPGSSAYVIIRPRSKILSTDPYNGNDMTITGGPTAVAVQITADEYDKKGWITTFFDRDWSTWIDALPSSNWPENPLETQCLNVGLIDYRPQDRYEQPPYPVIAYHCSIDMLYIGTGAVVYSGEPSATTYGMAHGTGDPYLYFNEDGTTSFQNPGRCYIKIMRADSGTIGPSGANYFQFDTFTGPWEHMQAHAGMPYINLDISDGYSGVDQLFKERYYPLANMGLSYAFQSGDQFVNTILPGIVMKYPIEEYGWTLRSDGINGTTGVELNMDDLSTIGMANSNHWYNISDNTPGNDYLPSDNYYSDLQWTVPSVVFRATATKLVISVLGQRTEIAGSETVTLSGCTQNANNKSFLVHSVEYMQPMSEIPAAGWFGPAGDTPVGIPIENWGDHGYITIITIFKSDQVGTTFSEWEDLATYGDTATVTFTMGDTQMSTSHIEGTAPIKPEWNIFPLRNGAISEDIIYQLLISAQNGTDYSETYITDGGSGDIAITDHFNDLLSDYYPSVISHAHLATVPKYQWEDSTQPLRTFNFSSSGTVVKIPGDWTATSSDAEQRNYIYEGLIFRLSSASLGDFSQRKYRIHTIGAYDGTHTPLTIATDATGPGGGTAGNDGLSSQMIDADGALSGDHDNMFMRFYNSIRVVGLQPWLGSFLSITGWVIRALGVSQFQNAYHGNTDSDSAPIEIITRDFDFGNPSTIKAFYKVIITYKSTSDIKIAGSMDGNHAFTVELGDYYAFGRTCLPASSEWNTVELYLAGGAHSDMQRLPVKGRSFQIKIGSKADTPENYIANFELNDISVVYREL